MKSASTFRHHDYSLSDYFRSVSRLIFLDFDMCVYDYFFIKEHFARYCALEGVRIIRLFCNADLESCPSLDSMQGIFLYSQQMRKVCDDCICLSNRAFGQRISLSTFSTVVSAEHLKLLDAYTISALAINTKASPSSLSNHPDYQSIFDSLVLSYLNGKHLGRSADTGFVCVNSNYAQHRAFRLGFNRPGLSLEPEILNTAPSLLYTVALDGYNVSPSALLDRRLEIDELHAYKGTRQAVTSSILRRIEYGDFNTYANSSLSTLNRQASLHSGHFVYLLSSPEEMESHMILDKYQRSNPFGFGTQEESLSWFCNQAKLCPESQFTVRIHPRMLSNSRYKGDSPYLRVLSSYQNRYHLPNLEFSLNVKPTSYELISKSSLVFVSWSSIGYEALVLDVPSVALHPELLMYPIDLLYDQPSDFVQLGSLLTTTSLTPVDSERVGRVLDYLFAPPMFSARVPALRWNYSRYVKYFLSVTWRLWASLHLFIFGILSRLFRFL